MARGSKAATKAASAGDDRLSMDEMAELMDVVSQVDSLEIKVTIPVDAHRATIRGLPLDPVEAEPRQVFFFDTPGLDLHRAGIVVRARRIRGGAGDTVIKLRPVVPAELPDDLRHSGSFSIEVDIMPGKFVCSGSLKGKAAGDEVREAATGERPLRKLFNREQRAFFRDHAPADLDLDSTVTLGPTFALRSAFWPRSLDRKMVAEYWLYPDGSRLLEVSTKCTPGEALSVAGQVRGYFAKKGIPVVGGQETKTRLALEFHARDIANDNGTGQAS